MPPCTLWQVATINFRAMDCPFRFSMEVYYKASSNLIPYNIEIMYGLVITDATFPRLRPTGIDMKRVR